MTHSGRGERSVAVGLTTPRLAALPARASQQCASVPLWLPSSTLRRPPSSSAPRTGQPSRRTEQPPRTDVATAQTSPSCGQRDETARWPRRRDRGQSGRTEGPRTGGTCHTAVARGCGMSPRATPRRQRSAQTRRERLSRTGTAAKPPVRARRNGGDSRRADSDSDLTSTS